jgi:peroxiredoxin family protein
MTEESGVKKKATIIVCSGDMDKLIGAYIIGTGAAAMGMEVVMFHTFWGIRALKKNVHTGQSLFGRMLGFMYGGDITKAMPSKFAFGGIGRWMFNKMMKDKGVASLLELRQMAVDLGVKLVPCQMSMDVMEIRREDLIDGVDEVAGVASMLADADESRIQYCI